MSRRPPPPSSSAPQESVQALKVVKRKIAAPSGPPPPGMTAFRGPRQVDRVPSNYRNVASKGEDEEEEDDDYEYNGGFRGGRGRPIDDNDDSFYRDDEVDDRNYDFDEESREISHPRDDSRDYDRSYDRSYDRDDRDDSYIDDDRDSHRHRNDNHSSNYAADGKDHQPRRDNRDPRANGQYADQGTDNHQRQYQPQQQQQQQQQQHHHHHQQQHQQHRAAPHAPAQPQPRAADPGAKDFKPSGRNMAAGMVPSFKFEPLLKSTYRELRNFVLNPLGQKDVVVRCYIERNRSGTQMMAPIYSLCADLEDGTGRELVICRKVWQSRNAHYVFSLKSDDLWRRREQRSRLYLGKLRQTGPMEYTLFDNGICAAPEEDENLLLEAEEAFGDKHQPVLGPPDANLDAQNDIIRKMQRDRKAQRQHDHPGAKAGGAGAEGKDEVSLYRRELCVVHFNCATRPAPAGTRGMEVCIPYVPDDPTPPAAATSTTSAAAAPAAVSVLNLAKPFSTVRSYGRQNDLYAHSLTVLGEKTSCYDALSACLVEFKGRAHVVSVKNFQLVQSAPQQQFGPAGQPAQDLMLRSDAERNVLFQMGKTTEDCFNMDFRHPLSLFQAFAIAIARFDAKLKW